MIKIKCTLENSHGKKSEHIRRQVKSVQMNVKQHGLGTSKNEQNSKQVKMDKLEKRTENKLNKEIVPFFPLYWIYILIFLHLD